MVRPMLTASPYQMISVADAAAEIVERAPILTTGQVAPWTAEGRVLAEDIRASGPLPAEPRSAMDGYAIRAGEGASRRLLGEITAGSAGAFELAQGDAARIMTGGVVPSGADTVVMVEDTREDDGRVDVLVEPRAGSNIVPVGADLEPGQIVVSAGTVLGPARSGCWRRSARRTSWCTADRAWPSWQPAMSWWSPGRHRGSVACGIATATR